MKPETPLPWTTEDAILPGTLQDAAYIAHAANAYPKLVEALREVIAGRYEADASRARALLRELGEE